MLLLLDRRGDARKRLLKVHRIHSVRLVDARRWKRSVWRHRYVRSWQCALKARIISGGGFPPDNCR